MKEEEEAQLPQQQRESVHLQLISSRSRDAQKEEEDKKTDNGQEDKKEEPAKVRTATLWVYDPTGRSVLPAREQVQNDKQDNQTKLEEETVQILDLLEASLVSSSKNKLLFGLELSHRRFDAWVRYVTGKSPKSGHWQKYTIVLKNIKLRRLLRDLWKQRRLVTLRSELLAMYLSDGNKPEQDEEQHQDDKETKENDEPQAPQRRGGFRDLLAAHTDRLIHIVQDEREEGGGGDSFANALVASATTDNNDDNKNHPFSVYLSSLSPSKSWFGFRRWIRGGAEAANATTPVGKPVTPTSANNNNSLVSWLEQSYGAEETLELKAASLQTRPEEEQLKVMQKFLDWFRSHYPYFYDKCDACGASHKADGAAQAANEEKEEEDDDKETTLVGDEAGEEKEQEDSLENPENEDDKETNDDDEEEDDGGTFLGYVYPSEEELQGRAGRTELYHCHVCGAYTRFPRYHAVHSILASQRGRCGEYGMLLFRLLRALGHEARWVVDWADHVWAEFRLHNAGDGASRWVHLDPCEAAVDQPLLYQGWGKTQTYIVAFGAPLADADNAGHEYSFWMEDVTHQYTSDSWKDIWKRREEKEEEVASSIRDMVNKAQEELSSNPHKP